MSEAENLDCVETAALAKAKEAMNGSTGLSRALGGEGVISPQAISQWKRVPAERVLQVERVTGVPRHELRPDIYPDPERAAS